MAGILFGADICLRDLRPHGELALDEFKIRDILEPMTAEHGGPINSYTLLTGNVKSQLGASGRPPITEFLLVSGLI